MMSSRDFTFAYAYGLGYGLGRHSFADGFGVFASCFIIFFLIHQTSEYLKNRSKS